jgi:hypothetical protein
VTLAPGAGARFSVTYIPVAGNSVHSFRPTVLEITPPNTRQSYDLPWRYGAVAPTPSVGPVRG